MSYRHPPWSILALLVGLLVALSGWAMAATGAISSNSAAARQPTYTVRVGDSVSMPRINLWCDMGRTSAGTPDNQAGPPALFCKGNKQHGILVDVANKFVEIRAADGTLLYRRSRNR